MKTLNTPPTDGEESMVAVWSMDDTALAWDGIAIDGRASIVYEDGWGEETPPPVELDNPTYQDLFKAANTLIVTSGDDHHVFVEDFMYDEKRNVWCLITGS